MTNKTRWPVVPLCEKQLRDIRPGDVLENGLYRLCDTYRGGGGYDKFADVWFQRRKEKLSSKQFVVQLSGCPLRCPYCYVTPEGINGEPVSRTTSELLKAFKASGASTFHLMGGAPALYLRYWKEIADKVTAFHSDFLLCEHDYDIKMLTGLGGLHAVSLKSKSIYTKTQYMMLVPNLRKLIGAEVDFYITFTGDCEETIQLLHAHFSTNTIDDIILKDSFHIPIMKYKSLEKSMDKKRRADLSKTNLTFEDMNDWTVAELRSVRSKERKRLTKAIQRRDSLKGEILFLQNKIKEVNCE